MEQGFSDTKTYVKLGEVDYLVNFGILARRRIEESHPGFNLIDGGMPDFEIIPFLIQKGVDPKERKWKNENEFLALFEAVTDLESLQKVPLAYQNALGFTNQHFAPWLERASGMLREIQAESKENQTPS